ncbi:MAG: Na+/H+ antiporter NhaA, partial [Nitrospirae bacterium]
MKHNSRGFRLFPERREIAPHLVRPFHQFFEKEASSSILLLFATALALLWANLPFGESYHHFWEYHFTISIGDHHFSRTLREWIDDGLMTFFFFTVGLEIKREMLVGELSTPRRALLPACAALGGMVVPAVIYFLINHEGGEVSGWGIPMATDIAFALGVLYILGKRVPTGLRVFLSAFAIADDLGAVLVIALFYTHGIAVDYLSVAILLVIIMMIASYFWVRSTLFYAVLGLGLWFAVLGSGLHATVVGIIVAFLIPARGRYDTDRFIQEVQYYMSEFQCPSDGCGHSILLNQRH